MFLHLLFWNLLLFWKTLSV
jgi:hypothetical protein